MNPRDVLHRYPLFGVLDPARMEAWLGSARKMAVDLGTTLFQSGTPGQYVYIVEEGRVRVFRPGKDGREISLGVEGPGDLFGEYALVPPGLNTATCRAAERTRLIQLPLQPLRDAVAGEPEVRGMIKSWMRVHTGLAFLRDRCFLGFMSMASVMPLLDCFETVHYQAGNAIQAEGLSADRLFVIQRGQVGLRFGASDSRQGFRMLGPGDSFGERALVRKRTLPFAEAVAGTECLALSIDAFHGRRATNTVSQQTFRVKDPTKAYIWIGQQEAADCGVAALTMVARYHELDVSQDMLRERVCLDREGATLAELQRVACSLGLKSQAVRISPEHMAAVTLPAIAHLTDGHYVVVYERNPSGIVVGDPARGIVTLSPRVFEQTWSRHLLLVTPLPVG